MCDPVSLAAMTTAASSISAGTLATAQLAIGALSAGVGLYGQNQQMKAQEAYNKAASQAAVDAANQTYQATQTRMAQEVAAASTEKINANIASAEARATATTAAGEAGVQGLSINNLIASYYAKQGRYNEALDTNLQMSRQGLADSMVQTSNQARSTIQNLPVPQAPNYLDAAIRVAGSGLSAATDYYKMTT